MPTAAYDALTLKDGLSMKTSITREMYQYMPHVAVIITVLALAMYFATKRNEPVAPTDKSPTCPAGATHRPTATTHSPQATSTRQCHGRGNVRLTPLVAMILLMAVKMTEASDPNACKSQAPHCPMPERTRPSTELRSIVSSYTTSWRKKGHVSHATSMHKCQPFNFTGDGPFEPNDPVQQLPLKDVVTKTMSTHEDATMPLRYVCANVFSLQTYARVQEWQGILEAADADYALLVGTKLTTTTAHGRHFKGYRTYHSIIDDGGTWLDRASGKISASRGVAIAVKEKYDVGDIRLGTGNAAGRMLTMTLYVDKDGTGKKPLKITLGAVYYDAMHDATAERGQLSDQVKLELDSDSGDATHYFTDANNLYKMTDRVERKDEEYVHTALLPHDNRKMYDLQRTFDTCALDMRRLGAYTAKESATFQHPNIHTIEGQQHVLKGRQTTARIIDHSFSNAPEAIQHSQIDVAAHNREATDHGIQVGTFDMNAMGVTMSTKEKEDVDVMPTTYDITMDRPKAESPVPLTNASMCNDPMYKEYMEVTKGFATSNIPIDQ